MLPTRRRLTYQPDKYLEQPRTDSDSGGWRGVRELLTDRKLVPRSSAGSLALRPDDDPDQSLPADRLLLPSSQRQQPQPP